MASSVPGTTGETGKVVAVLPPLAAVQQVVTNTAVRKSGLGTRHRCSSSKGIPTLTVMAMERRVNHSLRRIEVNDNQSQKCTQKHQLRQGKDEFKHHHKDSAHTNHMQTFYF